MGLNKLLDKRLLFVSGKGGVGKTSLSILLGLYGAKRGMNTLIVEMNSLERVAPIFGLKKIGAKETALAPNLSAINLCPKKCFEEYVLKHIRFQSIYKTVFNNKFVTNFLDAVPGLNEILLLGKIFELERATEATTDSEPRYDLIIVDAPATGHGLSTLEVPQVIKEAVKVGPLHANATRIQELLRDKNKTAFCLVTLAEEMPVIESQEYIEAIKKNAKLPLGPIFVNQVMPKPDSATKPKSTDKDYDTLWSYYDLAKQRYKLNSDYVQYIKQNFKDQEQVILPFQFHSLNTEKDFKPLIKNLEEQLA